MELPKDFIEMLGSLPGHEGVAEALTTQPSPVCIRLNPAKTAGPDDVFYNGDSLPTHEPCVPTLTDRPENSKVLRGVAWEPMGLYLAERPAFTLDPALYDGRYYVQDASSMITGEAIRRLTRGSERPMVYLDACAAPGGKTTAALAALPEGSLVVANEYDGRRALALMDNLARWGVPRYAVTTGEAQRLGRLGAMFDIVAADVPCSGEGMMRKHEAAVSQWSRRFVDECAALQRDIVGAVWRTLRPGGYLLYSTCTFNTRENEENVRWIRDSLGAEPIDLGLAGFPGMAAGLDGDIPAVRMLPGRVDGEGQFLAVLRKPDDAEASTPGRLSPKNALKRNECALPDWLTGDYVGYRNAKGDVYAIDRRHADTVAWVLEAANTVQPGVHVGSLKGRDLMPAQGLATSLALRPDAFPVCDVDRETALSYLRGEAVTLPSDTPRGFVLISCGGCRLGWAKNIGSRANNLFPRGLRVN